MNKCTISPINCNRKKQCHTISNRKVTGCVASFLYTIAWNFTEKDLEITVIVQKMKNRHKSTVGHSLRHSTSEQRNATTSS